LQGGYIGDLQIAIYDNLGRKIKNIPMTKDTFYAEVELLMPSVSSSVYYMVIVSPEKTFVEKLLKN